METMPGGLEWILIFVLIVPMMVFGALITVIPFWRICTKAGFRGPCRC